MNRWMGRVALVTGASVGIGASICRELVKNGMKVIGCARNVNAIEKLADELASHSPGELLPIKCDVTNELEILNVFQKIREHYGQIDVCINNAGLSKVCPLMNGKTDDWKNIIDVNVLALCIFTREAITLMKEKEINDGQIIHISSILAHHVKSHTGLSFYSGTKHMVKALAEGLRQELRAEKSKIRVCCISPGQVETEFLERMLKNPELAKLTYKNRLPLQPENIANAVLNVLKMPDYVDINDIIVQTTE
ncbi:dehydrogenase/reductase SDR family member 11-like [Centruroides vittatus]|uniref:dehydrogenase/reductase SDR family member 11-like n=1 Tax=Centruroides vittatus TaxID=120091 RepID=UPI00350F991D